MMRPCWNLIVAKTEAFAATPAWQTMRCCSLKRNYWSYLRTVEDPVGGLEVVANSEQTVAR